MQERPVARRSEALSMLDSLGLLRKVSSPEESLKKLSFPEDSLSKLAHGEDSVGREMLSKLSSADVSGGREKHRGVEVGVVLAEVGGLTPREAVQHPAVWLPWIMADTPAARPMRRAALKAVIGRHYGVGMMSVADRAAFAAFVLVLESFNEVHLRAGSSEASPGELAVIEAITIQMHALRVGALWSQEQKVNFLRKMVWVLLGIKTIQKENTNNEKHKQPHNTETQGKTHDKDKRKQPCFPIRGKPRNQCRFPSRTYSTYFPLKS